MTRPGNFVCMWHGLSIAGVARMLKYRPKLDWYYLARWFSIGIFSIFNSLANGAERCVYGRRIKQTRVSRSPLFVLGHWRSGTTLLHNLLSLDPAFSFPNLYQCMRPGHFLLTERFATFLTRRFLPKSRPMDNMALGWELPMEDEMAIAIDCGLSPYLMAAFHGRTEVWGRFFDPKQMTVQELRAWKASLLKLLKKLTLLGNKTIVLKSPTHTFRVPLLLEMFPEARFIYIYRNPQAVYRSTLHLRQTLFVESSLEPPRPEVIPEETFIYYEQCVRAYEQAKSLIPAGRLCELRFEDLEEDVIGQMSRLYRELDLPGWAAVQNRLEQQLPALGSYRKNQFNADPETTRKVAERLGWISDLYGYPR